MICEKGLGVSNDCLPATQSSIFAFSAGNSKIVRTRARIFFDLRAPERLRFGRQHVTYARFSPSRIEPVPLNTIAATFGPTCCVDAPPL
jgi:hypothetical protein